MNTIFKSVAFTVFLQLFIGSADAQIIVNLTQPPPYQFKIEHLWKVSLMNPSPTTYRVYLVGRATEKKDGRIVEATTTTFSLPPGLKVVGARELAPLDVKESNTKYSDVVKNIGGVPSGDYDICVSVYNSVDNALLGEKCMQSQVTNLTQVELLQPEDGTRFSARVHIPDKRSGKPLKLVLQELPKEIDARYALYALLKAASTCRYCDSCWPCLPGDTIQFRQRQKESSTLLKTDSPNAFTDISDTTVGVQFLNLYAADAPGIAIGSLQNPESFLSALKRADDPWILLDALCHGCDEGQDQFRQRQQDSSSDTGITVRGDEGQDQYRQGQQDSLRNVGSAWNPGLISDRSRNRRNEFMSESDQARFGSNTSGADRLSQSSTQSLPGGVMIFSWLPPIPVPPGARVTYTLRIAEILGRQSPYDAVYSNPASIALKKISTNIVQIPLAARRLRFGARYAWKVDVYLNGVFVQQSEVRGFSIDNPQAAPEEIIITPPRQKQPPPWSGNLEDGTNEIHNRLFASLFTNPEFLQGNPEAAPEGDGGTSAFKLIGSARVETRFASRQGSFSEIPKNYVTANLQPGVMLYGLPFTGSILFSTLQDANKQSLNSFGINFDFASMTQGLQSRLQDVIASSGKLPSLDAEQLTGIANPSRIAENLDQYNAVSGAEKFFLNIRSLGIGTNYPSYSDYVLNGVPVTGINLEFNPGILYTAFTASKNQRPVDNEAYQRDLYAGRLGIGKKETTHLFFTGLYVTDDASSMRPDSMHNTLTPRENYVFGMEGKLNLFDEHLALEGEGAMSLYTRDTRDPEFASSAIPSFVKNLTNPRLSSSVDYMYSGRLVYTNAESATKISAGAKMIGPGYTSLGVPNLRTDQFGYEAKLDQQLFDRRVTIGSFFRTFNDNLIDWKSSTTTMTAYGINLGFNFPRLPFLRISYSPISQKNNASDPLSKFETNMNMISVTSGYAYSLGSINSATSFAFIGQQTESNNSASDFKSNSYMLGEMLSFQLPLTIGVNVGMIESRSSVGYGMIQTIDLNGSAPLGDFVTVGVGITSAFERDRNERIGFYANSTVNFTDWLVFDLRLEKTNYNEFLLQTETYREFLVLGSLSMNL